MIYAGFNNNSNKEGYIQSFLEGKGYSSSLIQKIMNPQKRLNNYTKDDICDELVLRSISVKAYNFVRGNTIYPSVKYLHLFLKTFQFAPGFLVELGKQLTCQSSPAIYEN